MDKQFFWVLKFVSFNEMLLAFVRMGLKYATHFDL